MGDWGRANLFKGLKVPLNLIPHIDLVPLYEIIKKYILNKNVLKKQKHSWACYLP